MKCTFDCNYIFPARSHLYAVERWHAEIKGERDKCIQIHHFCFGHKGVFNKTCPSRTQNHTENAHCEAKC